MLRHLSSVLGAAGRLPSVVPAGGLSIPVVVVRVVCAAAAIGLTRPRATK
jgi:hypothetical protein